MSGEGTPSGGQLPPFKFDATRWSKNDRIAGIATFVLFIALFLPWFGVNVGPYSFSADGLTAHGYLYIPLILSIIILVDMVLKAGWAEMPFKLPVGHEQGLMIATAINLVLVVLGFLLKPGGSGVGWKFGAFIGLIAAVVAAAPTGVPAIQARRSKS